MTVSTSHLVLLPSFNTGARLVTVVAEVLAHWRPVLVAYVLIMAFTLVYTAEHYVVDILLGWAFAGAAVMVLSRYERRRKGRKGGITDPCAAVAKV